MEDANVAATLAQSDPVVAQALVNERNRQQTQIELIASENIVSDAVRYALGHEINNKTLEGYPGRRFHGGGEFVDVVEQAAIDRACDLFAAGYANVQPHSGTQANQAVFFSLLKPGDRILSLDLAAGGHLSHGAKPNLSGRWFEAHHYGVNADTGLLDYREIEKMAETVRPRLLITGGSAYPHRIDFARFSQIARSVGALLMVDMAHFAGLVAGGVYPSPLPYADIVTCTTTKTLRGPRGGLILTGNPDYRDQLQASIFPGVQGSLHSNVLAAKAICLGEALQPEFKEYASQVLANARTLATVLKARDFKLVGGGTDTHMVLLDLGNTGICGADAESALAAANITSNKNPVPFDSANPANWVGLRLGVAAATTRGFDEAAMSKLGNTIADLLEARIRGKLESAVEAAQNTVATLSRRFMF